MMTKRYYLLKKKEIYEFIDSEEAYFRTSSLEELLSISEDTLNQQDERIQELEKVNIQFKGQRDYLLWAMERLLPKEKFEEQKSYLMDINEDGEVVTND